jgi:hypothetical protein
LIAVIGAPVLGLHARQALIVFQTEGRLVSLRYFPAIFVQDVERGKQLHAVVVHVAQVPFPQVFGDVRSEVGRAYVDRLGRKLQQAPCLQVPVGILLLDLVRLSGHTVLLHGTLQEEHLLILQMGRLLHFGKIEG